MDHLVGRYIYLSILNIENCRVCKEREIKISSQTTLFMYLIYLPITYLTHYSLQ